MMFLFPGKTGCLFAASEDSDNGGDTEGRRLVDDLLAMDSGGPVERLQTRGGV